MTITDDDRYIGRQIQSIRLRRGLTQQVLADRVGISRSKLAKYEAGTNPLDSRKLLYALAGALEVSIADLTGHAEDRHLSAASLFHSAAPRIESALLSAGHVDDVHPPSPVDALSAAADRALALRMAGDLATLGKLLPDLLTDSFRLTETGTERDRNIAWSALSRASFATALASKGLGYTALAWIAAKVTGEAANMTGDMTALAASEFVASQVLLSMPGSLPAALHRVESAADSLQSDLLATPEGAQLYGMLHLQAGLTTAALGRDPADHLAEARETAHRTGEGGDAFALDFGPANVAIWEMSIALESGNGGRAVQLATAVDPAAIGTAERRARFFIEAGRGHAMQGQYDDALAALLRAETIAPQYVRSRVVVRELAGYMLRRARRELSSGELGRLAQRVGAVPDSGTLSRPA
ncbi:helix-turn-helix domain-containing protein [Nocardia abscessus]|uniref:helix-turn-helix domain-containing protein n=1 Tax=Nocardia abscessus TaxID=120957 RepID=UPI0024584C4A|nr:helix-turn-helix transcriptional regulator [Nocardia abscessus]